MRLTTVASFPVPGRGELNVNIKYKVSRRVAELHRQAIATSNPKMQKLVLVHAHAVAFVNMVQDELHHLSSCHLESLSMKHGSCIVTNFESTPIFAVAASDFALNLRVRLHLPCRIAPLFNTPGHLTAVERGVAAQAVRLGVDTATAGIVTSEQRKAIGELHS